MSTAVQAPQTSGPTSPEYAMLHARYNRGPTDILGDYLRRIGRGPLLTAGEVDLARQIEAPPGWTVGPDQHVVRVLAVIVSGLHAAPTHETAGVSAQFRPQ